MTDSTKTLSRDTRSNTLVSSAHLLCILELTAEMGCAKSPVSIRKWGRALV